MAREAEPRHGVLREHLVALGIDVRHPGDAYSSDTYWLGQFGRSRGHPLGAPDIVVRPTTVDQVSQVVRVARQFDIPVVPWGAGSGSQGGSLAVVGGIVLDTRGLDRLLSVDRKSLTATVQSGMMSDAFEAALNQEGLMYPHYPASAAIATVGGYAACRGSGVMSTRYGKIEDLVLSLQVVLPDGDVIRTPRVPRHAVGPDLMQVFIGSEGTLGIITEMTVRVLPLPDVRTFHAIQVDDIGTGIEVGRQIIQAGLRPSVMRLYDTTAAGGSLGRVIGETLDRPTMVLLFEGQEDLARVEAEVAMRMATSLGSRAIDPVVAQHWWEHRYDFYVPPNMPTLPSMWGTIEVVARYADIGSIYEALRAEVLQRYGDRGLRFPIHFSHWYPWGTMLYGRFTIPQAPSDADEARRLHDDIWAHAVGVALERGGVMNDHHGVGLKLAPYMRSQYGPAFHALEAIKRALDPQDIMNPGKLGFESARRNGRGAPAMFSHTSIDSEEAGS